MSKFEKTLTDYIKELGFEPLLETIMATPSSTSPVGPITSPSSGVTTPASTGAAGTSTVPADANGNGVPDAIENHPKVVQAKAEALSDIEQDLLKKTQQARDMRNQLQQKLNV